MIGRFLAVGLVMTLNGHAQTPAQASDKPSIRVTTRMVQVNVVVHRGSGPSTGLTKEDFQIFDKGKEQRIAAFSGGVPSASTTGSSSTVGAAGPAPRVFSNRNAGSPPAVTIILFDGLNTPPSQLSSAKAQVMTSLSQLEGNNSIALYALGARLLVLHDFTQNTAHLRDALERYPAGSLPPLDLDPGRSGFGGNPAIGGTNLGAMAAAADTEMSSLNARQRTQLTLSAIEAIARHVQPIPGRKNLVWISSGFPVTIRLVGGNETFHQETINIAKILTDADLAVYPIHAGGLSTAGAFGASVRTGARRPTGVMSAGGAPESMQILADETGGRAYYNTNDLGGAVQHAISETEATYTLGFYPAEENLDGKFHEIKVHVKAHGTDIRYRKGYFATAESTPTPQQRQAQLNDSVASPFESTAISMKVRIDPADQPKAGSFRLIVGIDLKTLNLAVKGDHHVGGAQLMLTQQSANGLRLTGSDETIRLDLAPDEFERMTRDGLVLVKYIEPAADAFEIRVFVLDNNSGELGSVFVPVVRVASTK